VARDRGDPQRGAPGKLKAAARHWATSRQGGRDELDDDLRSYDLADQIKPRATGPFGIWPENTVTVRAFMELEFCWVQGRTADGSSRMMIAPEQIRSTLELLTVKRRDWQNVFDGLKIMEQEALEALHS
jgi:hypothetical protein